MTRERQLAIADISNCGGAAEHRPAELRFQSETPSQDDLVENVGMAWAELERAVWRFTLATAEEHVLVVVPLVRSARSPVEALFKAALHYLNRVKPSRNQAGAMRILGEIISLAGILLERTETCSQSIVDGNAGPHSPTVR